MRQTQLYLDGLLNWMKPVPFEKDDIAITGGVTGPFTTCWLLMGYERIAYALYDSPQMLMDIFHLSNEFNKEAARLSVAAGADAMWISDDLGDSSRGFMRLPHFQEYYLPYLWRFGGLC